MAQSATWLLWLFLAVVGGGVLYLLSRKRRSKAHNTDFYAVALNQLIQDDWDGALESLKRAIASGHSSADAYIKLGSLLRRRGDHMAAFQLHQSLTVRPDLDPLLHANVQRSIVEDYRALGRHADALQTLQEIAKKDRSAKIQKEIAHAAVESGEYSTAVKALREAQQKDSSLTGEYVGAFLADLGERCLDRKRQEEAKQFLQQALKEDGECSKALLMMGDLAYQEPDPESALYYWQKLLFAIPAPDPEVHQRLEKVYFDLGKFGDIERVYAQILENRPHDVQTLLASARIATKKGEVSDAEQLLRAAREASPESNLAFQMLSELYLDQGKNPELRELISAFLEERATTNHSTPSAAPDTRSKGRLHA